MFGISSPIDKLISALGQLKFNTKKYEQSRHKAFECMGEWARKDNNIAVEDVTIRMEQLFCRFNSDFAHEKTNAISNVSTMFKRFKKFDLDMKKFQKHRLTLVHQEEKYKRKIRQCPTHKNIRDYEVKFEKMKRQRELAEFKMDQLSTEIESTKSILFKKEMIKFNEIAQRQNEAEQVLFTAMKDLLEQIPDISGEEVDDLSTIRYENKEICAEICVEAKRRLTTLSTSRLVETITRVESIESNDDENESTSVFMSSTNRHVSSFRSPAKTLSASSISSSSSQATAPLASAIAASGSETRRSVASIFPRLDLIAEQAEESIRLENGAQTPPPPTYSDSESHYSCMRTDNKNSSFTSVTPTAPSLLTNPHQD